LLSEVAADPSALAIAAAEDYLTSKAVVHLDPPARLIRFLPMRTSAVKDTLLALPQTVLVAVQVDGTVQLLAPSGESLLSFSAGHERPVTLLAVSPSWAHGDTLIATGDAGGTVRVHKVIVKPQRIPAAVRQRVDTVSPENDTRYLGASMVSFVNISVTLKNQLEALSGVDGEAPRMTALAMASQQGSKYFTMGDAEGKISVFSIDGTFKSRLDGTSTPGAGIEGFYVHLNQLLFRAGPEWGYIDLENLVVKHVECPDFEGSRVTAAIIDSQQSWKVLVADEEGTLWVLAVRGARSCRVEHRFARGLTRAPIDLVSVRGFLLGLERGPGSDGNSASAAHVVALNMSHAGRSESDLRNAPSPVVWRSVRPPVAAWAVFRHRHDTPAGDLLAFLSEDGKEVEIMELLMQLHIAPVGESILLNPWITLPIVIMVVLAAVGWHYLTYGRKMAKSETPGNAS